MLTRLPRLLAVCIAALVAVGALGVHAKTSASAVRPARLTSPVPEPALTVAELARERGIAAADGRLLAVLSRRVLDPHAFPATYLVDGAPAQPTWWTRRDAALTAVPGADQVERVVSRRLDVPADTRGGLLRPGKAGAVLLRVGEHSGEEVSRRVLSAPVPGPLRRRGSVLLTFDDGPDPRWTPQVLDLLKGYGVHAVFCVIGREVTRNAALVRRVVAEGHQLCDHTMNHDEHLDRDPVSVARREIARGADAVTAVTGSRPTWFRAPGGAWSERVERYARESRLVPLRWTVDPRDWTAPPATAIVREVLAQIHPGAVVLLHDGGGDRSQTVVALRRLLRALPRMGLRFADPAAPHAVHAAAPAPVAGTPLRLPVGAAHT